jgi:thiol-disulfide isomerase/thioredoxin
MRRELLILLLVAAATVLLVNLWPDASPRAEHDSAAQARCMESLRGRARFVVFVTDYCPWCRKAEDMLQEFALKWGWASPEIKDRDAHREQARKLGVAAVPDLFLRLNGQDELVHLGAGYVPLETLERRLVLLCAMQNGAVANPGEKH